MTRAQKHCMCTVTEKKTGNKISVELLSLCQMLKTNTRDVDFQRSLCVKSQTQRQMLNWVSDQEKKRPNTAVHVYDVGQNIHRRWAFVFCFDLSLIVTSL